MPNESNPHIKVTLTPNNTTPGEIVDVDIWFMHSQRGGGTFTLKAKLVGHDSEKEIYSQTQHYPAHGVNQRIENIHAPSPGLYDVIASVLSPSGEELTSYTAKLLVAP
jgi:hypothetical protein